MSHPSCDLEGMTRIDFLKTLIAGLGVEAAFPGVPLVAAPALTDEAAIWSADHFNRLEVWERRPLLPLRKGRESRETTLIAASREKQSAIITYDGGSTPGSERVISPVLLFLKPRVKDLKEWLRDSDDEDLPVVYATASRSEADHLDSLVGYLSLRSPSYVLAWCHRRQEARTFHVGRISAIEII
jgi:predicted DNA-binding transcriptional regulator YafY